MECAGVPKEAGVTCWGNREVFICLIMQLFKTIKLNLSLKNLTLVLYLHQCILHIYSEVFMTPETRPVSPLCSTSHSYTRKIYSDSRYSLRIDINTWKFVLSLLIINIYVCRHPGFNHCLAFNMKTWTIHKDTQWKVRRCSLLVSPAIRHCTQFKKLFSIKSTKLFHIIVHQKC